MEIAGKKVLVFGCGRSGVAAARFLSENDSRVSLTDSKPPEQLSAFVSQLSDLEIELHLGGHPESILTDVDFIVLSPGVPLTIKPLKIAESKGIPILAEVELAYRFLKATIVGITGSNGKSTTTALTAHLLNTGGIEAEACGNIGRPMIDFVRTATENTILVVELSSFQLEATRSFRPHVATVLNITPDHMDRYPDFSAYKQAKLNIYSEQDESDFAVINRDETHADEIMSCCKSSLISFATKAYIGDGMHLENDHFVWEFRKSREQILHAGELSLPGPHNLSNAMAAASMAMTLGAGSSAIAQGLKSFSPLEHRLEPVAEIDDVLYVNDSKATNVDSAAVALQSYARPVIIILGGRDKDGDFKALSPILESRAKLVVLLGEAAPVIEAALSDSIQRQHSKSLEHAVSLAASKARAGDVVLLAPGCASFDMFDSFEHRGREFKRLVMERQNE